MSLTHRWACPFLCLGLCGLICKMTLEQTISGAPPSHPKSASVSGVGARRGWSLCPEMSRGPHEMEAYC